VGGKKKNEKEKKGKLCILLKDVFFFL